MQRANPEPDGGKCKCGRPRNGASNYTYRSHADRYVFYRCECGAEWTDHLTDVDPTDPVSSDEVIEVHKRLAKFEGSIADLIEKHLA